MWARTVRNVTDLNVLARARMAEAGALTGPEAEVAGRVFQAGDWIVCHSSQSQRSAPGPLI
jgi:hypothetical protein